MPVNKAGDFDGSGLVDFDDLFRFAEHFGRTDAEADWDPAYDLQPNGVVDFDDFALFAEYFGS